MTWTPIWRQAHTAGLPFGIAKGKNKTIVWKIPVYAGGDALRVTFLNQFGKKPCRIKAMGIKSRGKIYPVTYNGETMIEIPTGTRIYSDEIRVEAEAGTELEVRICMADTAADTNMTEEDAICCKGNLVFKDNLPHKEKPEGYSKYGFYYAVPAVESIEVHREKASKVIAAFGDSITAMNRWVKPLQNRLYEAYGDEFVIVNEGITGNCLTYEVPGFFGKMFGEKGTIRYMRDMEGINGLSTVIFALGTNDFSYADGKNKELLSAENVMKETEHLVNKIKGDGIRVVGQTIMPRYGYFGKPVYNGYMNEQRLKFNAWVKESGLFDYVFDADAVLRDAGRPDWLDDRYHQGDHLHPNAAGGRKLAEAYDLAALTGKGDGKHGNV